MFSKFFIEQQLFPAELNLAQLRAALYTSYANLYKAMGGGWVAEADKLTARQMGSGATSDGAKDSNKGGEPAMLPQSR